MSNDKESPSKEALNWCTEYAENSCCSVAEDNKLMKEFDTFWRSAAGHCPGCLTNVKAFQCAYSCSPSQADFVTVKRDAAGEKVESATIRMCSQFCSSYHSSCSNVTIAEMEGNNANAFCQGFVSIRAGAISWKRKEVGFETEPSVFCRDALARPAFFEGLRNCFGL